MQLSDQDAGKDEGLPRLDAIHYLVWCWPPPVHQYELLEHVDLVDRVPKEQQHAALLCWQGRQPLLRKLHREYLHSALQQRTEVSDLARANGHGPCASAYRRERLAGASITRNVSLNGATSWAPQESDIVGFLQHQGADIWRTLSQNPDLTWPLTSRAVPSSDYELAGGSWAHC